MKITELNNFEQVKNISQPLKTDKESKTFKSFEQIFNNIIETANKAELTAKQDIVKVATGDIDNLHEITINAAKAELAVQMLVQVRNKALDAYNEIMRISL